MKYKITTNFCWFRGGSMIVKMYFINGMPFTFDELPEGHLRDQDLIKEADKIWRDAEEKINLNL